MQTKNNFWIITPLIMRYLASVFLFIEICCLLYFCIFFLSVARCQINICWCSIIIPLLSFRFAIYIIVRHLFLWNWSVIRSSWMKVLFRVYVERQNISVTLLPNSETIEFMFKYIQRFGYGPSTPPAINNRVNFINYCIVWLAYVSDFVKG